MSKIQKIRVTKGVYYLTFADNDLRILCGCPADCVKHLMKRGIIVPVERNGVAFETGPNAILLSDIMLQNGVMSNLAEFPVLQMLYRQGMMLPDHPNNTGTKPLIIGAADQVSAQMKYIHRGNYGLVSEREIMATGIERDRARVLMRMKLKFAFGRIQDSGELLDSLVVGPDTVDIRDGVSMRRLERNIFEFSHQGETVAIDLNLAPNESYEVPFLLGMRNIPREYFAVIHSGDGDGWDENRLCMSRILMYQGKIYLIDAGPNILYNLRALGISINEIEGIFHTHAHDDHFAGLTDIIRSDHKIRYFATPLVRASVPCTLFKEFVEKNGLLDAISLLEEKRDFLRRTWLFGESLSHTIQNTICQAMRDAAYADGEGFSRADTDRLELGVVKAGCLERVRGGGGDDDFLTAGEFFGEASVLYGTPDTEQFRAHEETSLYFIPAKVISDVPVVMWKLLETHRRRTGTTP